MKNYFSIKGRGTLYSSLFTFLLLFILPSFLSSQECTSTIEGNDKENCLPNSPFVEKWGSGFNDNESRIISFDVAGPWTIGEINIVIKAGQIGCDITSIIGPECTGGCAVSNLIQGTGGASIDGRDCSDPSSNLPNADALVWVGNQQREIRYLGSSMNMNGTTRFYYCVNNNVAQQGSKKDDCGPGGAEVNNCYAAISHISLLPLECGENDCTDIAYVLTPTQPTCLIPTGEVNITGTLPSNKMVSYSEGNTYLPNDYTLVMGTMVAGLMPGNTYTFRVLDVDTGCFTDKQVTISAIPSNPVFNLTPSSPTCPATTGSIALDIDVSSFDVFYSMGESFDDFNKFEATASPVTGLTPGKYTFRVTDPATGCYSDETAMIIAAAAAPEFSMEVDQPQCTEGTPEEQGLITVTSTETEATATLRYSPGATYDGGNNQAAPAGWDDTPFSFNTGTYTFRMTLIEGVCSFDLTIIIEEAEIPEFELELIPPSCGASQFQMKIIGTLPMMYDIQYRGELGSSTIMNTIQEFENLNWEPNETFFIKVVNTETGCETEKEIDIPSAPTVPAIELSVTSPECVSDTENGSIMVSGIGEGETVQYSSGAEFNPMNFMTLEDNPVDNLIPGAYTFRVTNSDGCFTDLTETILPRVPDCYMYVGSDPCSCAGEGLFDEVVTIMGPTGKTLVVDVIDASPLALGDLQFEEVTPGKYELEFTHENKIGFSFYIKETETGGRIFNATNSEDPIFISNVCAYPEINTPILPAICDTEGSINLAALVNPTTDGTLEVIISRNGGAEEVLENGIFEADDASPGTYSVRYEFTGIQDDDLGAGTTENPALAGCEVITEFEFILESCEELPLFNGKKYLFAGLILSIFVFGINRIKK